MRELSFISDQLAQVNKELGISNYAGFLESCYEKVKKLTSSDVFYLDVFMHSTSRRKIDGLMNGSGQGYITFLKSEEERQVNVFGQIFSAVALVIFDETFQNSEMMMDRLKSEAGGYKLLILVNFLEEHSGKAMLNELTPFVKCILIDQKEFKEQPVELLIQKLVPETGRFNRLKQATYLKSLSPLFIALEEVFLAENKAIKTRKVLNAQNVQISRKEEQGLNLNDLTTALRQVVQKAAQDLDKNFRQKYDDLNKPNTGQFSLSAQKKSLELKAFVKEDLAEKSERVSVSIDKGFQERFLKDIIHSIHAELEKDERFIKSSVDDLLIQVDHLLKSKGIQTINKEEIEIPFPSPKKVIQSYCYIGKNFSGELTKHGVTEYFIALRDYIGVMMVATGLIAPLNIIASLSDEHSFIKPLAVGIKYGTALITIGLIIYGIFDLRKRIPRKRVEEMEKEIGKGREFLLQEARRMYNESSRDWINGLSTWVKEVMQQINILYEKNIKDMQLDKSGKMNLDKSRQLRLQQSIETIQNNITSAERIKDQFAARFRDMVLETDKDLKF